MFLVALITRNNNRYSSHPSPPLTSHRLQKAHILTLCLQNVQICAKCFKRVQKDDDRLCMKGGPFMQSTSNAPVTHLYQRLCPGSPGCHHSYITPSPSTCLFCHLLPAVPLSCKCCCMRDQLTPGQQGGSFLPVCLLLLSSFTSWLDHQPCKEDLWPWSTQNGIW